jgi:speckle-type POZ protein
VSDFLKDDCLKINCTVGVVVNTMDTYKPHSIQVPESDIGSHFGALLENQDGADIVFNVGGERFHAHKLVMAARSIVFRNKFFEEEPSGSEEEIVIDEMDPKVFKVNSLPLTSFSLLVCC